MTEEPSAPSKSPAEAELERAGQPTEAPEQTPEEAEGRRNVRLGWVLGTGLPGLMAAQVVFADVIFAVYLAKNSWDVSAGVIQVFLLAVVVEVIGVVRIIVRSVFPRRDSGQT